MEKMDSKVLADALGEVGNSDRPREFEIAVRLALISFATDASRFLDIVEKNWRYVHSHDKKGVKEVCSRIVLLPLDGDNETPHRKHEKSSRRPMPHYKNGKTGEVWRSAGHTPKWLLDLPLKERYECIINKEDIREDSRTFEGWKRTYHKAAS